MNKIVKIKNLFNKLIKSIYLFPTIYEIYLEKHYEKRRQLTKNPFLKSFKRYSIFSQTDEDSIIDEVIKRLNIKNGNFIELGVGNGAQNNTLNLLAQGWKGIWIGNENLIFNPGEKLLYVKTWITKKNINSLIKENLHFFGNDDDLEKTEIDLVSIDLDGNDYYIWESILSYGIKPKIIVAEYNGNFGPRALWKMPYNEKNNWKLRRDNYFGASFATLNKLFEKYGYELICCNSDTGVNLFLVKKEYRLEFSEIINVESVNIFETPHYALSMFSKTHKLSRKFLEEITN